MRARIGEQRFDRIVFFGSIGLATALVVWFVNIGGGIGPQSGGYRIDAIVPTGASLADGARVTMAGLEVGTVRAVQREGMGARITLEIDEQAVVPIPEDSRVRVRQRTPVGENYVSIEAGESERTLDSGAVLAATQTDDYVEVDQLLSVLRGPARDRARSMIQTFAAAVDGRGGEFNELIRGGADALEEGSGVVETLAADRAQVRQLILQLGDVAAAVGDRSAAVETIAGDGLAAMRQLAAHDQDLGNLLEQLPGTLRQVRETSATLDSVSADATPVVADLADVVDDVEPAVDRLTPSAREGQRVLDELEGAAPGLTATLDQVEDLSGPAKSALPQLRKVFCQVNPMLRYARPYRRDITANLVGLGSAANSYDAIGHVIRLTPVLSENALVGLPEDLSRAAHTLIHAGALNKTNGLSFEPYPEPNSIGTPPKMTDAVGPADVKERAGYHYPRILADC